MQDVERIDSIGLEELDLDTSQLELPAKPEGERLSDEELQAAATSFLASLRTR